MEAGGVDAGHDGEDGRQRHDAVDGAQQDIGEHGGIHTVVLPVGGVVAEEEEGEEEGHDIAQQAVEDVLGDALGGSAPGLRGVMGGLWHGLCAFLFILHDGVKERDDRLFHLSRKMLYLGEDEVVEYL